VTVSNGNLSLTFYPFSLTLLFTGFIHAEQIIDTRQQEINLRDKALRQSCILIISTTFITALRSSTVRLTRNILLERE
jgi:hypothetical protein